MREAGATHTDGPRGGIDWTVMRTSPVVDEFLTKLADAAAAFTSKLTLLSLKLLKMAHKKYLIHVCLQDI